MKSFAFGQTDCKLAPSFLTVTQNRRRKRQQQPSSSSSLTSRRRTQPNFPTLSIDSTVSWHSPVELFLVAEKFVKNIYTVQIVFIFIRDGARSRWPPLVRIFPLHFPPIGGENVQIRVGLALDQRNFLGREKSPHPLIPVLKWPHSCTKVHCLRLVASFKWFGAV